MSRARTHGPCPFCAVPEERIVVRRGPCFAIWTNEAPAGSAMVIPVEHRSDAWSLTPEEWTATQELLGELRDRVTGLYRPDGWNIGWNVGEVGGQEVMHAHCHLVPRYADEVHAGRGMRWWLKQPENVRQGKRDT